MPEWEYCVIRGIYNTSSEWRTMYPRHYLFTPNGPQLVNDFRKIEQGLSESMSVARAIAVLGEQGWEMVGVANDGAGSSHSLYFKRLKRVGSQTAGAEQPDVSSPSGQSGGDQQ